MECQRGDDCLILRKKNYGTRTTTGYIPVWEHERQTAEEERAKEGKNEIDFGSTHPIVLRYQVTRSSLISDRQVGEREREKAGGVVSFQLPAPKTNDPHGRGVISPDPGLENATNYNRIRMVGAATRVEPCIPVPLCSLRVSYAVFALTVSPPPRLLCSPSPFHVPITYHAFPFCKHQRASS